MELSGGFFFVWIWDVGFRLGIWDFGCYIYDWGFRLDTWDLGLGMSDLWIWDLGLGAWDSGFVTWNLW